jgi:uncharacterized protein YqhQ
LNGAESTRSYLLPELNYGGQAVIEGVMMRGSKAFAVAVRAPSGDIVVHSEPLTAAVYTKPWAKWPFVRGLTMLWDSLGLGMRTLLFSADVAIGEQEVEFKGPAVWGTVAVSIAVAVGLFFLLPSLIAKLMDQVLISNLAFSLIEGVIRLAFFLGYVAVIGRWGDVKRVFSYHGAEHKTINAYEAGVSLDPDSIDHYSTQHMRCGTSFLLTVLLVSIVIFAPFRFPQIYWRLLSRIVMIPVVAGISYEFIKLAARHSSNILVRILTAPGLLMQRLTTNLPDKGMIEVALAAFKAVLSTEKETQAGVQDYSIPLAEQSMPYSRPGLWGPLPEPKASAIMAGAPSESELGSHR